MESLMEVECACCKSSLTRQEELLGRIEGASAYLSELAAQALRAGLTQEEILQACGFSPEVNAAALAVAKRAMADASRSTASCARCGQSLAGMRSDAKYCSKRCSKAESKARNKARRKAHSPEALQHTGEGFTLLDQLVSNISA